MTPSLSARPQSIDPAFYAALDADDRCAHLAEFISHGGYAASGTNQQIINLKKPPTATSAELHYKSKAVDYWARELAASLNLDAIAQHYTVVPAACSKLRSDSAHDDRILRVLKRLNQLSGGKLDVRPLLYTHTPRPAQHEGTRLSVQEIYDSLAIDDAYLSPPVRPNIVLVDDVFTQGHTFKASQRKLIALPNVSKVFGMFLAKAVRPAINWDDDFMNDLANL